MVEILLPSVGNTLPIIVTISLLPDRLRSIMELKLMVQIVSETKKRQA